MPDPVVTQHIRTVKLGGAVVGAIDNPHGAVHVGGQQYYGSVTINQGATPAEFVEALREAGGLSRVMTRLPEEQFRKLLDIVARVTLADAGDGFFRIYRATLPPTAHLLNNTIPYALLVDLCEQQPIKAWPPLIEFIERLVLVEGIEAPIVGELQRWVDTSAELVTPPTPAREIERLRQELRAETMRSAGSDALSWLLVYLEPDWLNRTQERKQPLFMVELVLWSPRTNGALVLQSEQAQQDTDDAKRLWTLDELPLLLDQAFARRENVSLIPDIRQLIIEVVAPSDTLLYGFERWKRNNTQNTYGVEHPLVVRLRDRLVIPYPADQKRADDFWRDKWNTFRDSGYRQRCEELKWLAQDDLDVIELQDEPDLACLGVSSPLLPEKRKVFDVLRDAGIPVAIWLRGSDLGPAPLAELPQLVSELIKGKPLSDLRQTIQRVRRSKEVRNDEKHIGNAITLLWDDPDHQPLKYGDQGVFV
jgi:hypothetical protein